MGRTRVVFFRSTAHRGGCGGQRVGRRDDIGTTSGRAIFEHSPAHTVHLTILEPADARAIVPELAATRNPDVWAHRYEDDRHGWTLSIATHAPPQSGKLSLGGFRIAPPERTSAPGFTTDREAIALAIGMEEKVHWSRLLGVGGPLVIRDIRRIVGG